MVNAMTYHIAICDDDNITIQQVNCFIASVCEKMNISYKTDTNLDGESLIDALSSRVCYDREDKENADMKYKTREYPQFSACGLNCGLCSRYYTAGSSRCPGCAGEGFSEVHPPCGILSCCQRKGLEYCFECEEFPCVKFDKWGDGDSFITHKNFLSDMKKAKYNGIEVYKAELNEKIGILEMLLKNHNNGRCKGLYCLAVNLLSLEDIRAVKENINNAFDSKIVVRLLEEMAEHRGISLKLRK